MGTRSPCRESGDVRSHRGLPSLRRTPARGLDGAFAANGSTAFLWRRSGGAWAASVTAAGLSTGQAWYDWYVAAAPDRRHPGLLRRDRGAPRRTWSGTTWTWRTISNKGTTGESIHPDQHVVAFEPGNPAMVYAGCDGGLFRSPDRGITGSHCNNGLVISEFEYLAQNSGLVAVAHRRHPGQRHRPLDRVAHLGARGGRRRR